MKSYISINRQSVLRVDKVKAIAMNEVTLATRCDCGEVVWASDTPLSAGRKACGGGRFAAHHTPDGISG